MLFCFLINLFAVCWLAMVGHENSPRLVTVPYNLPMQKMRRKAIKKWVRSGPLRSAYRRLVAACVASLPFVPHRYPEPLRQRKAAARLRNFAETKQFSKATQMPGGIGERKSVGIFTDVDSLNLIEPCGGCGQV